MNALGKANSTQNVEIRESCPVFKGVTETQVRAGVPSGISREPAAPSLFPRRKVRCSHGNRQHAWFWRGKRVTRWRFS